MLKTHLFYNDVIEHDGRIAKQDTFLGAVLKLIALAVVFYVVAHFVFHVL